MRTMLLAGLIAVATAAQGQTVLPQPTAPPERVVLVELFTSEGCSSCPPADQLLRQIDGTRLSSGVRMIAVSEHVTYWDHLGWKDPFSAETMTARQNAYGDRFHLDSVYTPQMVVNGETELVGGNGPKLQRAVETAHAADAMALRIGGVTVSGDSVAATISLDGSVPARGAELFAAIAEDETTQRVKGGENSGRTLAHASVARAMVRVAKVHAAGDSPLKLTLPPADAGTRRHLVVWAQEPGLGRVLAVGTQAF
jgi:hypothetical protein